MAGIVYNIGFKADTDGLAASLSAIQADIQRAFKVHKGVLSDPIAEGIKQASILESALKQATTDKGLSFINMNNALQRAGSSVQMMVKGLSGAGMNSALSTFLQSFAQADRSLIGINSKLKEMQRVLMQSVKFNLAMKFQNAIIGEIQSTIGWVKDLDAALTEIAIVAPEVGGKLDQVWASIISGSQELRVAAKDYAEAAIIFYQQGLDPDEVDRRTQITIKAAKASGQNVKEMSEQLTAVWNTYRMEGAELERAASIAAKLGAETAAAFEDIAVGMQIAASGASILGVSYESLAAIMTTVRETTQQSASSIGNAYKTIFARFSNLKTTGEDAGESLGWITQQLADLGVNVLDSSGELRDLDDVIMQLGTTWGDYSRKQQIAISQVVGGVRQYQQFLALMQNFDGYQKNLLSAQSEMGGESLTRQYQESLESIESLMTNASESWRRAFSELFKQDYIKAWYKGLEGAGDVIGDIITGLGGIGGILAYVGGILLRQIGPQIENMKIQFKSFADNFTLERQINKIRDDINRAKQELTGLTSLDFTGSANFGAGSGTSADQQAAIDANNVALQQLDAAEKAAIANTQLNRLIKEGNDATSIRATHLQQQIALQQQLLNKAAEELKALKLVSSGIIKSTQARRAALRAEQDILKIKIQGASGTEKAALQESIAANAELQKRLKLMAQLAGLSKVSGELVGKDEAAKAEAVNARIADIIATLDKIKAKGPALESLRDSLSGIGASGDSVNQKISQAAGALENYAAKAKEIGEIPFGQPEELNVLIDGLEQGAQAADQMDSSMAQLRARLAEADSALAAGGVSIKGFATALGESTGASIMLLSSFSNLVKSVASGNASFLTIATSLTMMAPAAMKLGQSLLSLSGAIAKLIIAKVSAANATKLLTFVFGTETVVIGANTAATLRGTMAKIAGAIAAQLFGVAVGTAIPPVLLLTIAILALIAPIIVIIGLFMVIKSAIENHKKGLVEQAALTGEAAKRNLELADSLQEVINSLQDAKKAFDAGEISLREYNEAIAEVVKQIEELNKANPELDLMFTGNIDQLEKDLETAQAAALQNAVTQSEEAMALFESTISTSTKNGVVTRDLDKGFWGGETKKLSSLMQSYGAEDLGGNQFAMEEVAANYNQIISDLINAGDTVLANKFKKHFEEMEGFQEYLEAIDTKAEATKQIDYSAQKNDFLQADSGDQVKQVLEGRKAMEEYNEVQRESLRLDQEAAELSSKLADAKDKTVKASIQAQLDASLAEKAALLERKAGMADVIAKAEEFNNLQMNAFGDNSESGQELQDLLGAMAMLESSVNSLMFSEAEWAAMNEEAIALALAGESEYIGILDQAIFATERKHGAIVGLNEAMAEFDPNGTVTEQTAQVNAIQEQIDKMQELGMVVEDLRADFLSLTNAQQEAVLADMEQANSIAELTAIQEKAIAQEAHLEDYQGRLDQINLQIEQAVALGKQESEYQDLLAQKAAIEEYLFDLEKNLETSREEAANAALVQQKKVNAAIVEYNKLISDAKKNIEGLAASDFEGSLYEQKMALEDVNGSLRLYNEHLQYIGAESLGIPELTEEFLLLSAAEQEAALAAQQLAMARIQYSLDTANANLVIQESQELLAEGTETLTRLEEERIAAFEAGDQAGIVEIDRELINTRQALTEATDNLTKAELEAEVAAVNLAKANADFVGLDFNEVDQYADHLLKLGDEAKKSGKSIDGLSGDLAENRELALAAATAIMRMNRGVESLAGGLADWKDVLTKSTRSSQEYAAALGELSEAMGDLLNTDASDFSEEFLTAAENIALMEQAAEGSAEAIEQLGKLAAEDYFVNVVLDENASPQLLEDFNNMMSIFDGLPDLEVGVLLDDADFIDAANELIRSSGMTAEQVNAMFGKIGLKPQLKMTTQSVEQTQPVIETLTRDNGTRNVTYTGYGPDGEPINYTVPMVSTIQTSRTTGYTTEQGAIQVPELEVDPRADAVSSFEVVSRGAMNNFSPQNAGGGPPGGGRKGGGGGGRGGGGGGKSPTGTRKSPDRERYKDTNAALHTVNQLLSRLNSAEDKAFGVNRLAAIMKKNQELQKQGLLYDRLVKEAKAYLEIDDRRQGETFGKTSTGEDRIIGGKMGDKDRLKQFAGILAQVGKVVVTPKFDGEGFISNAEVMFDQLDAALAAKFNASTTWNSTEQAYQFSSEAAKASYDNFSDMIDGFKEQAGRVDETNQQMKDSIADGVANIHEWLSGRLKEVDYKISLRIRINQRDLDQLQWLIGRMGERANLKWMDNMSSQADSLVKKLNILGDAATRYLEIENNLARDSKHQGFFIRSFGGEAWKQYQQTGHITEEMMDKMTGTAEEMQDVIRELWELNDEMWRVWHETLQQYIDDFDRLIGLYDSHASMLESWANIWRVTGTPWKNQQMAIDLLNKSIGIQSSKVQGLSEKYELLNSKVADAEKLYNMALSDYRSSEEGQIIIAERYQEWQDLITQTAEARADMMGEVSAMMDMIENAARESAAMIARTFTEELSGLFSEVESAMNMYNQKKSIDTFYVNSEEAGFKIAEMLRNADKEMDGIADPVLMAQHTNWADYLNSLIEKRVVMTERLGKMVEEEIWVTKEGVDLREVDLEIMQKEFELAQAKAAFEDQQAAKSTMRLARDASGNWSYVYSADGEEDEGAEEDIEQKIHNIRALHRQAADEAADMWLQVWVEYRQYVEEIDQQRYQQNDAYRQEVDARMQWYEQHLDQHASQIVKHNEAIDRSFEEMTLSVITNTTDMMRLNDDYKQNNQDLTSALEANHNTYQAKAKETLGAVGISYSDLENVVREETDKIMYKNRENEEAIRELRRTADQELDAIMVKTAQWAEKWRTEIEATIAKLDELIAKIFELEATQAGERDYEGFTWSKDYTQTVIDAQKKGGYSAEYYRQQFGERFNKIVAAYNDEINKYAGEENRGYMDSVRDKWAGVGYTEGMSQKDYINKMMNTISVFDTGGMATGPQIAGLAMDGKKELVLNSSDTSNMLKAIEIMRDSIAGHLNAIGMKQSSSIAGVQQQEPQSEAPQTPVIIQADFPNVSAREEIEAAFANLVNQAAQYQLKPRG